jgi:hypothetical protein
MTNIAREVEAWAEDEIGKQRFGEDYAYAVMLTTAIVQGPEGQQQVPMWALLLTARSPILTEGPMFHGPVPLGAARPAEKDVRAQVAEGIKALRGLARSKLAGQNGHAALTRK